MRPRLLPRLLHRCNKLCEGTTLDQITKLGALAYQCCRRYNVTPHSRVLPQTCHSTLAFCDTNTISHPSWYDPISPYLPLLLLTRGLQAIHLLPLSAHGLGTSLISSGTLRKRTVQRKPSMLPICLPSITSRELSERCKSTSAAYRLVLWWATLRKWTVQRKPSTLPICLPSITLRGSSERRKSTGAANRFAFWWACFLTPRALTGRHKSTSAANLLELWCSPGRQTEKRQSSMPPLCWSSLGHTRAQRNATGRRKSTSVANLLQPQRPQETLTERHKPSMPPTCWVLLGQILTPRGLTGRRKSTSVANLLEPWCPQVVPTERHKSSTPLIRWFLSGLSIPLRSATVKQKSLKAADLLQSRWSPAPLTVRRKSRRAAKLSVGAGALCFSFWVRCERRKIPYGSSIAPRLVRVAKWKKCPIVVVCYMPADGGASTTLHRKEVTGDDGAGLETLVLPIKLRAKFSSSFPSPHHISRPICIIDGYRIVNSDAKSDL